MWHVTCDTWHVTHNTWHVGEMKLLWTFQVPSFNGLGVMMFRRLGGKGSGICRTAPATPGLLKLDGVALLLTDLPLTSFTTLSEKKKIKLWHLTWYTWHLTRDTWHMTYDTWHVTHDRWGEVIFSPNFSSLVLTVWEWGCSEDFSTKDHWLSQLIN